MARRGFTLIEMVVVIFFVSLALVGVMSGIRNIAVADSKAYNADLLQKLALEKIKEIGSITDPNTVDAQGNFAEQGYPEVTWQVSVASSGLANLDTST